jgi:hypothetical protein
LLLGETPRNNNFSAGGGNEQSFAFVIVKDARIRPVLATMSPSRLRRMNCPGGSPIG